jgi:sarcosine oxidase subunit gamma
VSAAVLEFAPLQFEDGSARPRCGCKGPGAERWLRAHALVVPAAPNSLAQDGDGVLVVRLASAEFLIEAARPAAGAAGNFARVSALRSQLAERAQPRDVYPVARQDRVLTISGTGLQGLLRQVCSVDFAPLLASARREDEQPVVLTSMIGVGVVAWPHRLETGPAITLWCDPSFGHFFWNTLLEVGREAGSISMGSGR